MDDEICRFQIGRRYCKILAGTKCDGKNKFCSFYKTEFQFCRDADHAILINREKGNCETCKYNIKPCEVSGIDEAN